MVSVCDEELKKRYNKKTKKTHAKRKLHAFSATVVLQVMCGPKGTAEDPKAQGTLEQTPTCVA